jgi:hypothetical protein
MVVVDAEGSWLVLGSRVSQCASDKNELSADIQSMPASLGKPATVLADNGYLNEDEVRALESDEDRPGTEVLVSVHGEGRHLQRQHDFRPLVTPEKQPPAIRSEFILEMKERMEEESARKKYRRRMQTVEPVFGIIKKWMGFDRFLLRGIEKVRHEWNLVTLAYNFKRLWTMKRTPATAA